VAERQQIREGAQAWQGEPAPCAFGAACDAGH
jgi:hypothetical protein